MTPERCANLTLLVSIGYAKILLDYGLPKLLALFVGGQAALGTVVAMLFCWFRLTHRDENKTRSSARRAAGLRVVQRGDCPDLEMAVHVYLN